MGKKPRIMNTRPSGHGLQSPNPQIVAVNQKLSSSRYSHNALSVSAAAWEITLVPGVLRMIIIIFTVISPENWLVILKRCSCAHPPHTHLFEGSNLQHFS